MKNLTDCFTLSNGVRIPCMGFGTWQIPNDDAIRAVDTALAAGYRHFDTAAAYYNEKGVGQAVRRCGIPREELFITTKLWNADRGYDLAMAAFEASMDKLSLDYLDLYLIHWPANKTQHPNDWAAINADTWRAMEELYRRKRIRAIGVSNFLPHHLESLMQAATVMPMVNQIELHPGCPQTETVKFCKKHDILVEAWSPLGRGRVLGDRQFGEIAARYGKTPAQLCLRWCLQHGTLPLPKSVTAGRVQENAAIFDFEISADDMAKIDGMTRLGDSGMNPDTVTF